MSATIDPLVMGNVSLVRGPTTILAALDWRVAPGEHWLVLGGNGSAKTSLVRIAGLDLHPTTGTVEVLGERLGATDVRRLRRRIGTVSAALAAQLRRDLSVHDAVMTARRGALEPWWHTYDESDHEAARAALARLGVAHLDDRSLGSLSSGEQQRVLLARALVNDPALLLLDEPSARLDLAGRVQLSAALSEITDLAGGPSMVLVTHHLDEIPTGITHVLMLRSGTVVAAGPLADTLDSATLSDTFGLALHLEHRDGRFSVRPAT